MKMKHRERYEFGDFALDVNERRLSKGGTALPLTPKMHDVLVALVRRAGTPSYNRPFTSCTSFP